MKKIFTFIALYSFAIMHLPWTLVRVVVATTLLIDLWCDNTINEWLLRVNKEIEEESKHEKNT